MRGYLREQCATGTSRANSAGNGAIKRSSQASSNSYLVRLITVTRQIRSGNSTIRETIIFSQLIDELLNSNRRKVCLSLYNGNLML